MFDVPFGIGGGNKTQNVILQLLMTLCFPILCIIGGGLSPASIGAIVIVTVTVVVILIIVAVLYSKSWNKNMYVSGTFYTPPKTSLLPQNANH